MKRCSAQDLQRIYGDAPQELTDAEKGGWKWKTELLKK